MTPVESRNGRCHRVASQEAQESVDVMRRTGHLVIPAESLTRTPIRGRNPLSSGTGRACSG